MSAMNLNSRQKLGQNLFLSIEFHQQLHNFNRNDFLIIEDKLIEI